MLNQTFYYYYRNDGKYVKIVTVLGKKLSTADKFAKKYGFNVKNPTHVVTLQPKL